MVEVVGTAPTSAMFITKFVYRHSWKSNMNNIKLYFNNSIFFIENYQKITFHKSFKENKKGLNVSFKIYIIFGQKSFFGYFSHNGEYENSLTLFTKRKKVTINRVFSPPNDINLTFQVNESNIRREKKLQKDDAFLNYFKHVIFLLKTKKFENSYQILLKDSFFREKLIK